MSLVFLNDCKHFYILEVVTRPTQYSVVVVVVVVVFPSSSLKVGDHGTIHQFFPTLAPPFLR